MSHTRMSHNFILGRSTKSSRQFQILKQIFVLFFCFVLFLFGRIIKLKKFIYCLNELIYKKEFWMFYFLDRSSIICLKSFWSVRRSSQGSPYVWQSLRNSSFISFKSGFEIHPDELMDPYMMADGWQTLLQSFPNFVFCMKSVQNRRHHICQPFFEPYSLCSFNIY